MIALVKMLKHCHQVVVTITWVTMGYSLSFGPGDFIGNLRWGGLTGVNVNGDQEDRYGTQILSINLAQSPKY